MTLSDLTAAQLIALLREHPLTCGEIGITIEVPRQPRKYPLIIGAGKPVNEMVLWMHPNHCMPAALNRFLRWLIGAVALAHVEHGIDLPQNPNGWLTQHEAESRPFSEWKFHPTILHALLAGLEANIKETSK